MADVYTFLRNKPTQEIHLFPGKTLVPSGCSKTKNSVCNGAEFINGIAQPGGSCLDEDDARLWAAAPARGRNVCGTCVSHLYADLNDK